MTMKPVIETGWKVSGEDHTVSASSPPILTFLCACLPSPLSSPACGGGGGLGGPACPGSPVGCNELTSDPIDQI